MCDVSSIGTAPYLLSLVVSYDDGLSWCCFAFLLFLFISFLTAPERKPAPVIPGLWDSKLKARAMTQNYGVESSEAKLAWEEVEEIASSGLQNSLGGTLYNADECDLSTAAEACMALEELDRFFTNFNNKQ